jgi:hypothetical protein
MDVNSTDLTIKDYLTCLDRFYFEQVMFYMKKMAPFCKGSKSNDTKYVAKFIVPDLGDRVTSGIGFSSRPARLHKYIGRRAGMTTLCRSQLHPPVRNYEFGYSISLEY